MTFDSDEILNADASAATRILPLINTITNLDVTDTNMWVGQGIDSQDNRDVFNETKMIGGIRDYGLISYIVSLMLVFTCCIRRFFSLETLIFILFLSAAVPNIAYAWGILMIFTTVKYFKDYEVIDYEE